MARVRLNGDADDKVIALKTTKVELTLFQQQLDKVLSNGRAKITDPQIVMSRDTFTHLVNDFNAMLKLLKSLGIKGKHALHYNEHPDFHKRVDKVSEKDVPAFLRKQKETAGESKRVKLK